MNLHMIKKTSKMNNVKPYQCMCLMCLALSTSKETSETHTKVIDSQNIH